MPTTHHLMCIQRSFIPLNQSIISTPFPKIPSKHTPHTTPLRQPSRFPTLSTNQTTLKPTRKKKKKEKHSHPTSSSSSPPSHTSHSAPPSSTGFASVSASASLSLFSIPFAWVGVSVRGVRRRRFGRRKGGFLGWKRKWVWRWRSP